MADKATVVEALSAVMADVQAVRKTDRNSQQNYQFRGVDAVVNAVGPVLRKHGVIVVPTGVDAAYRDVQTSTGKPSRECTVTARYRFYGPAGDFIDAEVPGESMDFGDKGAPKAMSVAYRILLLQALCIPTDEPDADSQSYERDNRQAEPPRTTDVEWLEDWRARLIRASTASDVAALDAEARQKYAKGQLAREDVPLLEREIGERRAELSGSGQAVLA